MRPLRILVIVSLLVLVTPSVLAGADFSSNTLQIDGDSALRGTASAFFLEATSLGASWDAKASQVVVERTYSEFVGIEKPRYSNTYATHTESRAFEASTLVSSSFRDGGAILVRSSTTPILVDATTTHQTGIAAITNPRVDEGGHQTTANPAASRDGLDGTIHETIAGTFVNLTSAAGDYELRGDITLQIYEVDYSITSGGRSTQMQTGRIVTDDKAGVVEQGRFEAQVIHLRDATLRVRAPSAATLFSQHPLVTFSGELTADNGRGNLEISTLKLSSEGHWTGSATLDLAADGGLIHVAPSTQLAASSSGARAAAAPQALQLALVLLALAALVVTVLVMLRRHELGADHLELALLAMEERRWTDALPHLDRVLAKRPTDASLLMDRALCLEEAGRLDAARAGYEAALAAEPHNAELHYYYARVLVRLRMTTAAMAHLTRALSLDARLAELARGEPAFGPFADHPGFVGLVG
ncbi:MAG: tetratricopeptide repeat protein [Candidatus Thermoplasmatota archaeon]